MDLARLKALIDLAAASKLGELDVTENGIRVRIRRRGAEASAPEVAPVPGAVAAAATSTAPVAPVLRKAGPSAGGVHAVASPMYGIFHRAPSPDSPPFVEPGRRVKRGDKLCLIEAMKVFNVVEADADGTVSEILAENGAEVELGQSLFRIAR